jgi:hypothetical protein
MTRTTLTSRVGPDGILTVTVPLAPADANEEVLVTIESVAARPKMTPAEWRQRVESLAGRWQGEFERPPQGEYEEREPL